MVSGSGSFAPLHSAASYTNVLGVSLSALRQDVSDDAVQSCRSVQVGCRDWNVHRLHFQHTHTQCSAPTAPAGNLAHYALIPRQSWKLVPRRRCEIRFWAASAGGNGFAPSSCHALRRISSGRSLQAGPGSPAASGSPPPPRPRL